MRPPRDAATGTRASARSCRTRWKPCSRPAAPTRRGRCSRRSRKEGAHSTIRGLSRPRAAAEGCCLAHEGDLDAALEAFEQALQEHERAASPFERARTQLAYGAALRRAKRRADARAMLTDALEAFDALGRRSVGGECRSRARAHPGTNPLVGRAQRDPAARRGARRRRALEQGGGGEALHHRAERSRPTSPTCTPSSAYGLEPSSRAGSRAATHRRERLNHVDLHDFAPIRRGVASDRRSNEPRAEVWRCWRVTQRP